VHAQVATLLADGRAVGRSALSVAYTCEVVAGRAIDSTNAANFVKRACPALIKRLVTLPQVEYASAREFLTTAWQSPRNLALAPPEPSVISSAPIVFDWVPVLPVDDESRPPARPPSSSTSTDEHCAEPITDTELLRSLMHALGEIDDRNRTIHPLDASACRGHLWAVEHDLALLWRNCYISLQPDVQMKHLTVPGEVNWRTNDARLRILLAKLDPALHAACFPPNPNDELQALVLASNNPSAVARRESERCDEDKRRAMEIDELGATFFKADLSKAGGGDLFPGLGSSDPTSPLMELTARTSSPCRPATACPPSAWRSCTQREWRGGRACTTSCCAARASSRAVPTRIPNPRAG
jgi:hypothetical protein